MNSLRRSAILSVGKKIPAVAARQASGLSDLSHMLQTNVWRKSNTFYLAYIVVGCVVLEGVYGTFTNAVWDTYNRGVFIFNLH
jgi:hypothetical protein